MLNVWFLDFVSPFVNSMPVPFLSKNLGFLHSRLNLWVKIFVHGQLIKKGPHICSHELIHPFFILRLKIEFPYISLNFDVVGLFFRCEVNHDEGDALRWDLEVSIQIVKAGMESFRSLSWPPV